MRIDLHQYDNIDFSKIKDKHIYTILGVTLIVVGFVAIYLLITNFELRNIL